MNSIKRVLIITLQSLPIISVMFIIGAGIRFASLSWMAILCMLSGAGFVDIVIGIIGVTGESTFMNIKLSIVNMFLGALKMIIILVCALVQIVSGFA